MAQKLPIEMLFEVNPFPLPVLKLYLQDISINMPGISHFVHFTTSIILKVLSETNPHGRLPTSEP